MNYMQWHLSNALEKKKEQKLRSKSATNTSPAPLVNQQITIRGRSETRKQVCNRHLMFWRVLIRFLTDLVSLKVEDLSLKELCTQVRQKKKKYVDESLPEWVWPNFSPQMCVIFWQSSWWYFLSKNGHLSNERLVFLWFVMSALNEKGFFQLHEKIKTSKKTHVNDITVYRLFKIKIHGRD